MEEASPRSVNALAEMVTRVVHLEGPVHEADLISRISNLWGTKAGSRIQAAFRAAADLADRQAQVQSRGPFFWRPDGTCQVRSRAETGIPGDRIAPEEFVEAIKLALAGGLHFNGRV